MRIAELLAEAGISEIFEALKFSQTSPYGFVTGRNRSKRSAFLSQNDPRELTKHDLYTARGGRIGYAMDPSNDLQNLYNNSPFKGGGKEALIHAIKNGGSTLDAFDPFLPRLYKQHGFVVTGRMKFNPEFAPAGWDFEKNGSPDVVFMAYNGGPRQTIERRVGTFPPYNPSREGQYHNSYDEAKAAQRAAAMKFNRNQQ